MTECVSKHQLKRYLSKKREISLIENEITYATPDEYVWDVVSLGDGQITTVRGYGSNRIPALFRRKAKLQDECKRVEDFIDSIEDSLPRMILTQKYINGLSWTGVALAVGGNNTADGVRKTCERFLAKR